ncbi:Calx-beta domain-containing protein [Geminocystis herdmanii]|uniref:Calx-beta domain-containing protein n=1 Tax=Geminocystis herdmanii TaxID=669359 RepID=UPI00034C3E25|nr:Calx-beta domain-containing protein [Geminocystis herdmanii]
MFDPTYLYPAMNKLTQALSEAQNLLLNASFNSELPTILTTAFGENYNPTEAYNIFSLWRNQDFSNLPPIQIHPPTILNNAQGGYSATTNTIYLSSSLIESKSITAIRDVLIEEIGHFIDAQINYIDTPGDEGELFSALVRGVNLSDEQLSRIQQENDHAIITIDGIEIALEMSASNDNFINSIVLTGNNITVTGNNVGATGETGEPTQSGTINSVWWSWTATSSQPVTINTNGSNFDTYLSVFTGNTINGLTLVARDDDSGIGNASQVIFSPTPGTTYQIAVDGWSSNTGNIVLNLNQQIPTITLSVSPSSVLEDGTTNLLYTFTRTGSLTNALTVNYNITGTANNNDYTGATRGNGKAITFAPGASTAVLQIIPTADTTIEPDETVILTLTNGTGYDLGATTQAIGTIIDDDGPGTIKGIKWNDINGNGLREDLIQGNPPDIVFVIDVSGSASSLFRGLPVGDVNNDGHSNTRLDAEIAAFIALNNRLVQKGLNNARVSIVTFESSARQLDMDFVTTGIQLTTNPNRDRNNNGIKDVEEVLRSLRASGATNFEAALQNTINTFNTIGTTGGNGNVIFISDGENNTGGSYTDEVLALRNANVKLSAFGVGSDASLSQLQVINPNASIFTSTDELFAVFDGLGGSTQGFKEPGLAGVTIYLDLNNNGILDRNEPTQVTATDDPNTPDIDETGTYRFSNLTPGTYTVREVVPTGFIQTFPNNSFHTVVVGGGQTVDNINFGNTTPPSVSLRVNTPSVTEDGTDNLVYTFTRTGNLANTLTVNYSIGGTADSSDYTGATPGSGKTITFGAGLSTATLTIDPTADTIVEPDETVIVTLASGTGYTLGRTTRVVGRIINDDPKVLSINNAVVIEGQQSEATLIISLNYPSHLPTTFDYATSPINATEGSDYTSQTGTLTIPANSTSTTVNIPILDDNLSEEDEFFLVTLSNPVNALIDPVMNIGQVAITDTLTTLITRTLPPTVENLALIGTNSINGTGNNSSNLITGNSGNNILDGRNGNDTLNGGTGADTMVGGLGNDTYYVDNTRDRVIENVNQGTDTVRSTITYTLPNHVEHLILEGTANINGTGNSLNNRITGNSGNNRLNGGDGNDTLNGGTGADTMVGGLGNDTYYVDNTGDRVIENANQGTDTVRSTITYTLPNHVEHLILEGTANRNGTGNGLNNSITGNSGNNRLNGGNGNDTLNGGGGNDTLNGGIGADRMIGGIGNDTYYVDNTGDRVIENANQGTDTVRSTITYTLPNHVEHLILEGTANRNGTGNGLNNSITGNSGNNRLNGGNGNDTLIGGAGNDTLTGGTGLDSYRFNSTSEGLDRITDFNVADDTILVSRSGFGGGLAVGTLLSTQFTIGSSATTSAHRFFYNNSNGGLFFDVDGSGATSAVQIATLNTGLAMTNADIVVI